MDIIPEVEKFYKVEFEGKKIVVMVTFVCVERSVFEGQFLNGQGVREREFGFQEILLEEVDGKEKKKLCKVCGG